MGSVCRGVIAAFFSVATVGCGGRFDPCFLKHPGASHRFSPSGRAVAFVDPSSYGDLVAGRTPTSFACVAREARPMFPTPPETLVIALNFEDGNVRVFRTLIEK